MAVHHTEDSKLSITRKPRPEGNYYILDKNISEDARLSWSARGLLIYLLGKPDNWVISIEDLRRQTDKSAKRTGRDGVYSLLAELVEVGYVTREATRVGGGQFGGHDYSVHESAKPLPESPLADKPLTAKPFAANPTLVSNDTKQELIDNNTAPPTATRSTSGKSGKISLDTFLQACKDAGEKAIPSDDPVMTYADHIGLPADFLRLAWAWFKVRYANKRQTGVRGWRQAFRNAVEGNWPKYWYLDDHNEWQLTTAGKQAQMAHEGGQ